MKMLPTIEALIKRLEDLHARLLSGDVEPRIAEAEIAVLAVHIHRYSMTVLWFKQRSRLVKLLVRELRAFKRINASSKTIRKALIDRARQFFGKKSL